MAVSVKRRTLTQEIGLQIILLIKYFVLSVHLLFCFFFCSFCCDFVSSCNNNTKLGLGKGSLS